MLDKSDVGKRLAEEMDLKGVGAARLAEKTQVTIQAIYGWTSTGRFSRRHYAEFKKAGLDLTYILTGDRSIQSPPSGHTQKLDGVPQGLSQSDLDLLAGYRTLTQELQTTVWDIIDGHMRRQHPDLAKALGPRDIARSITAEPRIITKQIVAKSKTPPQSKKKKSGDRPAGKHRR